MKQKYFIGGKCEKLNRKKTLCRKNSKEKSSTFDLCNNLYNLNMDSEYIKDKIKSPLQFSRKKAV